MALDRYRQKRDFSTSPEPAGNDRLTARRIGTRKGLFFCVQKHLASHLHYDLRLELDGVLLSWAVPKGPSIDPRDKRLAMQTEDHPYEYGMFEGVISEGYGAGIVMLWDHGTWQPESGDVGAALAKGDLKFTLDGYKLKGSWVLVRTRGYAPSSGAGQAPSTGSGQAASRSWLLIKHRDDWAGPLDIVTFAPLSVKSEGDFADILAADDPAVWTTNRPARTGDTGAMLAAIIDEAARKKMFTPPKPPKPAKAQPAPPKRAKAGVKAGAKASPNAKGTKKR